MKNIKVAFAILFFLCGCFFACQKKSDTTDNQPVLDKKVIAGSYDSTDFYSLLTPSIKIIENQTSCSFYSGLDSIDIDNSKTFELKFQSMTQLPDINNECGYSTDNPDILYDNWPVGRIYKFVQVLDKSYQIACDSNSRALCFGVNDTIENGKHWSNNNKITLIDSYNFPPPIVVYGNWNSKDDKYLGIRKVDNITRYGWIKINLSKTIEIKEIYFEK